MCLAMPGQIVSIDTPVTAARLGQVTFAGIAKQVSLALVPAAGVDDYVVVHAGFAISQVDERQARQTLNYLDELLESAEEQPA